MYGMGIKMKGFKDKHGKFRPTENKNGVRKSRDKKENTEGVRLSRNRFHPKGYKPPTFGKKEPEGKWEITETDYGSKSEFGQFLKNIDNQEAYYLGRLDVIIEDPRLQITDDHILGKIEHKIGKPIHDYKITGEVRLKPNTQPDEKHGKIYWTEDLRTDVTERSLKRVAEDAYKSGLISNNRISTLLSNAEFQSSDAQYPKNLNQPIIISLNDTNYIVAPYDENMAEYQREVMKQVVAEHKEQHEMNQT